jgi:hypothetical protein
MEGADCFSILQIQNLQRLVLSQSEVEGREPLHHLIFNKACGHQYVCTESVSVVLKLEIIKLILSPFFHENSNLEG